MVVLNNNGLLNNITEGATLSDLQTTAQTLGGVSAMTGNGLCMANAPLINAPDGISSPSGGTVTTLAAIDADKIYSTEAEAASSPATAIYVERGMAKVTVEEDAYFTSATDLGEVSITGFTLDLTNNVSYLVRNTTTTSAEEVSGATWWGLKSGSTDVEETDLYRFAGGVQVAAGLYRTYWAKDPNYDTAPEDGELNSIEGIAPELGGIGEENPQYCLENTFSVAHQNQNETTRAIIGVTLLGGDDFFIWGSDKSNPLDESDVVENILGAFYGELEVRNALDSWQGAEEGYKEYLSVEFVDEEGTKLSSIESSDDLQFAIVYNSAGINASSFGGTLPDVFDATSDAYKTLMSNLNSARTVAYYKGGLAYYPVCLKHFGDDLTPWNMEDVEEQGDGSSYPDGVYSATADNNWLGRYGVLRNNWYEINVTAVNNIGSPTVPEAPTDADDPMEKWISIEINMLSWAKRVQDAEL